MFAGVVSTISSMMQAGLGTWVTILILSLLAIGASSLLLMLAPESESAPTQISAKVVGSLILLPGVMLLTLFALRMACSIGPFRMSPVCMRLLGKI